MLNQSALVDLRQGLANEFEASAALMGAKNQIEVVMARLEGRKANFEDPAPME